MWIKPRENEVFFVFWYHSCKNFYDNNYSLTVPNLLKEFAEQKALTP